MNAMPFLFADVEIQDVREQWEKVSPDRRETLILYGALSLVILLLLLWALFLRKKRRREHHRYPSLRPKDKQTASQKTDLSNPGAPGAPSEPRKGRRHRRRRRPLNPTLSQTGGLPPIRGEDSSETS